MHSLRNVLCSQNASRLLVSLAVLLVVSVACQSAAATELPSEQYYLYISRLDYPREVIISSTFQISVQVNYSLPAISQYSVEPSSWLVAARLYNLTRYAPRSEDFVATSSTDEISGTGSKAFSITASAPTSETFMNLTVVAMYKSSYGNAGDEEWLYTHDPDSRFDITVRVSGTALLSLVTNNIRIPVTIDGFQHYETNQTGRLDVRLQALRWHVIEVPGTIDLGPMTHAVFVHWDDDSNSPLRHVYFASVNTTVAATYQTQFFLKVNNNDGSGWYDAGSYANITATKERRSAGLLGVIGFVDAFRGWSGDLETKERLAKVLMDGPHEISAKRDIQYKPTLARAAVTVVFLGAAFITVRYRARIMRVIRHIRASVMHHA